MQMRNSREIGWTALALLALLAWDASGLDMRLARAAGGAHGFALRNNALLVLAMHDLPRFLAWLFALGLCLGLAWPVGPLARLPFPSRLQLVSSALLASAGVALLKSGSHSSCPYELQQFGGVARHLSHWQGWRTADGGSGHCFPAGHASTGFAFIGGWFAMRDHLPGLARRWLLAALGIGFALGLSQQWRGAHFMSHTLWTAWICWCVGLATDRLLNRLGRTQRLQAR